MIIFVLSLCPQNLQGYISLFLVEIAAGVYVGNVSARIREDMWKTAISYSGRQGKVIMVYKSNTVQGYEIKMHNHGRRKLEDMDGLQIIKQLTITETDPKASKWSKARRYR